MQEDLARIAKQWESHGKTDPRWAVLSDNDKRGGLWDDASFYGSGPKYARGLDTEMLMASSARRKPWLKLIVVLAPEYFQSEKCYAASSGG